MFASPRCLLQRLVRTGLLPAVHRYQALAKALKRAVGEEEDEEEAPLEDST
jgi:hypothetical protein